MENINIFLFLLYHVYANTGQAYGRIIQTQPSYYRELGYMVHQKRKCCERKKAEKTPPNFNT